MMNWNDGKKRGEKSWSSWRRRNKVEMFFLIPKNVTSERPIALMPTFIRWWEALRAPEVAKWQQKYRVEWPRNVRNGGAQQTEWEISMEMRRFNGKGRRSRCVILCSGPGEDFRAGQSPCGLGFGNALPKKDLASAVRVFQAPEACTLRRMCGRAAHDHHGHPARIPSGVVCFCVVFCKMR